jgi:hypothetical protein
MEPPGRANARPMINSAQSGSVSALAEIGKSAFAKQNIRRDGRVKSECLLRQRFA